MAGRPIALLVLTALIGSSCTNALPSPRAPGSTLPVVVSIRVGTAVVTVSPSSTPGPGCSPEQVAKRIQGFLAAFNAGDQTALAATFDRSLNFSEPNPLPPTLFTAYGAQQLLDYFAGRHAQHESRQLVTLQLSYGAQGDRDRIDFGYDIQRTADDTNDLAPGKGQMSCATGTMSVWQMGSSRR